MMGSMLAGPSTVPFERGHHLSVPGLNPVVVKGMVRRRGVCWRRACVRTDEDQSIGDTHRMLAAVDMSRLRVQSLGSKRGRTEDGCRFLFSPRLGADNN